MTPRGFAGCAAAAAFAWAADYTQSLLPLIVVINSVNYHLLSPSSRAFLAVDVAYNVGMVAWYSLHCDYTLGAAPGLLLGWAAGNAWGGCDTWPGAIAHVCLCQLPAAYGVTHVL